MRNISYYTGGGRGPFDEMTWQNCWPQIRRISTVSYGLEEPNETNKMASEIECVCLWGKIQNNWMICFPVISYTKSESILRICLCGKMCVSKVYCIDKSKTRSTKYCRSTHIWFAWNTLQMNFDGVNDVVLFVFIYVCMKRMFMFA